MTSQISNEEKKKEKRGTTNSDTYTCTCAVAYILQSTNTDGNAYRACNAAWHMGARGGGRLKVMKWHVWISSDALSLK